MPPYQEGRSGTKGFVKLYELRIVGRLNSVFRVHLQQFSHHISGFFIFVGIEVHHYQEVVGFELVFAVEAVFI